MRHNFTKSSGVFRRILVLKLILDSVTIDISEILNT